MHAIYEELRVALHNIWRRRWLALAVAWAFSLLGWLWISGIPNTYESKASVFVDVKTNMPGQSEGQNGGQRRDRVEAITKTLLSNENLKTVVRSTDLAKLVSTDRELAAAAEGLRSKVEVTSDDQNQLEITAQSGSGSMSNAENAKLAKAIVQKLLDLYIEQNQGWSRGSNVTATRTLQTQLAQQEVELRKASTALEGFEAKYLVGLPGSGEGSVADRLAAARASLSQLDSQLITAQGALAAVNGQLGAVPPTINLPGTMMPGSTGVSAGAAEVAALQGQLSAGISQGWTESHPDIISLRSRLRQAQARAAAEGPGRGPQMTGGGVMPNPAYQSIIMMRGERQAAVSSLSAQRNQIQATLDQFSRAQIANPGVQAEQTKLQNAYDAIKGKFDELLRQQQDLAMGGSGVDVGRVKVISPPSPPKSPVAPNRPLLLTMMMILGLGAGGGVAFALSQIKMTYANSNRLEKATGLPVIGAVSAVVGHSERTNARQKLIYFGGCAAALAGVWLLLLVIEFWQRGMVA
jgi:polysaccharide chain length determinant protein (PEP-CTERM system associated)